MSERKLPNWIDAFLHYTNNTEPPFMFRKWTAISCIAAALQRKCFIRWGTALTFYPNMYVILVGPSATGKSMAMSAGLELIHEVPGIKTSAQATSLQALIRHLKDTNLTDIDLVTGEQTYHSSLSIFSKEFTVFLGYHNNEMMSALCDWYDCDRRWIYETISRKKEEIVGVWVNLLGGTTPDLIQSSLPIESIGGGLTSRIVFIYEERRGKLVTVPIQTESERHLYELLLHDLHEINKLTGEFKATKDFIEMWEDMCIQAESSPPFHDPKFDGYLGRRRTHLMKLSMIMSAATGDHDLILTSDDLEDAITALVEAENKMPLVFKGVGQSSIASLIHKATAFLVNSYTSEIPLHQFARYFSNDMDKFTLDRVLSTMEVSNMIKLIRKPGQSDTIKVLQLPDKPKDVTPK